VLRETKLRTGDRIRVVRLPPAWGQSGFVVPRETRAVYRLMIGRRRPVRISEVDSWGAWVRLRVRSNGGRIDHHSITIDPGCWVRVTPRGTEGRTGR
jgi:hypothetical protein